MNSHELCRLFSAPVQAAVATPSMYDDPLTGSESMGVADWAPNRRREFAAGRAAARLALSSLGGPVASLPRGPDRTPVWPPGIVGSISHCEGFCAAVAARDVDVLSLGFDVETTEPLPDDLHLLAFSPDEWSEIVVRSGQARVDFAKVGFSAKEAFYKCYYPLEKRFLDFQDVVIRFVGPVGDDPSGGAFSFAFVDEAFPGAHLAGKVVGRWLTDGKFICAGVTLARSAGDRPAQP
ncbi:4'-phosphopantetheinyl transferase superfamily protein [uncultured Rhodoblastus sp.]|uniref:4'-phosphopantetheinyl transferase family protein n=1 Tax=uncultured Rhodoblastus sp. TaxID=543037 RepID=UPI0025FB99D5|nr:4'-phosphopantetheinyl transferase superfamily protein [uncultured Rhodoblastus sp.]